MEGNIGFEPMNNEVAAHRVWPLHQLPVEVSERQDSNLQGISPDCTLAFANFATSTLVPS